MEPGGRANPPSIGVVPKARSDVGSPGDCVVSADHPTSAIDGDKGRNTDSFHVLPEMPAA